MTWLDWIPADIGKLATVIGLLLSIVLIYTHIKKIIRDSEEHKIRMEKSSLELELLRKEINSK